MKLSELYETVQDHLKWVVGNLGSNGILLKSQGLTIKLDHRDADALTAALKANDEVVVKSNDGKMYRFEPTQKGFLLTPEEDGAKPEPLLLTKDDVLQILTVASPSAETPAPIQQA